MQYKIPVQVENEDPIVLGLSLRQLAILMIGGGIAYSTFKSLVESVGTEIALMPSIFIFGITALIALFKQYEMTFVPFVLSLLRFNINIKQRSWKQGVDSFAPIEIGYVNLENSKKEENVDFESKMEKIKNIEDKLNKI